MSMNKLNLHVCVTALFYGEMHKLFVTYKNIHFTQLTLIKPENVIVGTYFHR